MSAQSTIPLSCDPRHSALACATPPTLSGRALLKMGGKFLLGTAILFAVILLVGRYVRAPMEAMGHSFLARFGEAGMALGTFLADAVHFPVPAQFYMVAAISGGASTAAALVAICIGSLFGGQVAFLLFQQAARFPRLRARLARSRALVDTLLGKYGYWGIALSSVLPIPFSVMCSLAGVYRLPYKVVATLSVFRVPVLIGFYLLLKAGWMGA